MTAKNQYTVVIRAVRIGRGKWQIHDDEGRVHGDERPYQCGSERKARDAIKAMYPANSVWHGHRCRGGWGVYYDDTRSAVKTVAGYACPVCGEMLDKYGAPNATEYGDCTQHGRFEIPEV